MQTYAPLPDQVKRLRDGRLRQRLDTLVDTFAQRLNCSIPEATGNRNDMDAAYDFFKNFKDALVRHPEAQRRVREEVDAVLGGRAATYHDVARLRYTEMAVKESLRLYPPSAFLFAREAAEDVELGGYLIRRGGWVFINPYVMHRDPRHFKDPEVFDPGRFAPGRADEVPAYAYLPFGGGPRICIGSTLATMEVVLVAATVLQRFAVGLAPGQPEVEPEVEVVLRPKGGLRMRLTARERPA
jgi:cytochrome P450